MKNIFLIVCLFFITVGVVSAQMPTVENWQTFAPVAEEFSIEVPAALSARGFGAKTEKSPSRRYKNVFDGTYFFVFSDLDNNPFQINVVRDFVKDFQKSGKSFSVGSLTGEKFIFTDNENFYHTVLFVKTNSRSYVFHAVSPIDKNPQVERFFASLQIKEIDFAKSGDISKNENSSNSETIISKNLNENNVGERGSGTGDGIARDFGINGAANQTSPILPTETKNLTTKNLSIVSKPRPTYNDIARLYDIAGVVRLRITFLANGEIGSVMPVTKLPFGLTNQAVIAAKSIRFEPAIKNGQPVSITKQVEYRFTIY